MKKKDNVKALIKKIQSDSLNDKQAILHLRTMLAQRDRLIAALLENLSKAQKV